MHLGTDLCVCVFVCARRRPSLQQALCVCVLAVMTCVFLTYRALAPLTYGSPELSANQLQALKWRDSWDILYRHR